MKKLSLIALTAAVLTACGENKPTPEDFVTIETELQSSADILAVLSIGPAGDYIVPVNASDAILEIANKDKSVTFLSAENPAPYIKEGQCLLNIIPQRTMEMMNMPENKCNFRLFCGNAEEAGNEVYAVEVCSE